ncbi:MAG: Cytidylate kinase [Parachlamydiales bacterium]|nr:Cytidylate kinase [Parachlamydiales bacterium]
MIIAIDGPSGTGKSTVAKGVAQRLGYIYFDTGAMYRCFAYKTLLEKIEPTDEAGLRRLIEQFQFDIQTDPVGEKHYLVNGLDVTNKIRVQEISNLSSQISIYPFVRQAMVKIQRRFGQQRNAVFEGRDMGTVVFPDAELKIFLTARPQVRAERRYRELLLKFPDLANTVSEEQILREIEERDCKDSTRTVSPLRQAKEAILIDTSDCNADEVVQRILELHAHALQKKGRMKPAYRCVYWTVRTILKLFYRLRIYGISHFRPGSAIIAANHASFFDPPVISVSCPEEVHFLAREPLFRVPILGRVIRILNSHPVSRDASDAHTFRVLIQLLQEGKKVILFPEGSRTLDGGLQPLEKGLSFLVYKARCAILPVYVDGTFRAWKRGAPFPKLWGRIRCVFGSPIEWEEFEGLDKREAMERITQRTEQSILALKDWLEKGAQGEPP